MITHIAAMRIDLLTLLTVVPDNDLSTGNFLMLEEAEALPVGIS